MESNIIIKAARELQGYGHSEGLFAIIDEVNEVARMLAVALQYANEGLSWLNYHEGIPMEYRISFAKKSLNKVTEILPDAHELDDIILYLNMINKLLTAIAIDQLGSEKSVIGSAKVA